ncbi:helix-turn-helix domain-containing protein [Rhizobium ruizarguesonis]
MTLPSATPKWSQEAVAEQSGLTVRTIQRIEAGERYLVETVVGRT